MMSDYPGTQGRSQPARANAMQSFQMKTFMQMFSNTLCGANNGLGCGVQCKPLRSFITKKHFKAQQHSLTPNPQSSLTLKESCVDSVFGCQTSLNCLLFRSWISLRFLTGSGLVVTFPVAGQDATLPETVFTTT